MHSSKLISSLESLKERKDGRLWLGVVFVFLLFGILCHFHDNTFLIKTNYSQDRSLEGTGLSKYFDPRIIQLKKALRGIGRPLSSDPIKKEQITNFRNGNGLIVSVHITHHAGTSLCFAMKKVLPAPSFACMGDKLNWPSDAYVRLPTFKNTKKTYPWPAEETSHMVESIRPTFKFVSWEFLRWGNIHQTDWEHKQLVSMIVMRDPLERFLAGGKCGEFHSILPDDPTPATQHIYWKYANSNCALNFAMRVLTAKDYESSGERDGEIQLREAKELLKRFTFIVDQACLADSVDSIASELNLDLDRKVLARRNPRHKTVRERFGNDTLYEYVRHRFRHDIALYEWAKTQSIVKCKYDINTTNVEDI